MIVLALSFFVTAILYAAVGFGGGSTYNALLVLVETDYRILPSIALLCNLIVVSGGTYKFFCAGYINLKRIWPWIITSVPAAWLGGYINISETLFIGLLGFSLLAAGGRMFYSGKGEQKTYKFIAQDHRFLPQIIGAFLGLLAGIVGIGGGIFLAPVLHFLRWGNAKIIAGACSVFILVNSLSGLAGQVMKLSESELFVHINIYWMLFPVVLIGGQIGSHMGAVRLNPRVIRLMTALLILYVSLRLIWRWWGLM